MIESFFDLKNQCGAMFRNGRGLSRAVLLGGLLLLQACVIIERPHITPVKRSALFRTKAERAAWQIDSLLDAGPTRMAYWGVKIMFAEDETLLYSRNADRMFMPASNMKLYTTSAALTLLGPQYRYETGFYTQGQLDGEGVLHGDLIVRGSGDPTWSWRFFDDNYDSLYLTFVDTLREHGIQRIDGRIIGDDNVFDDEPYGYGWAWDDEPYYYAAQLSGLSYNENYIDYKIIPDSIPGNPVYIEGYPDTDYLHVTNEMISVESDTSTEWESGRRRAANEGYFRGEYRISKGEGEDAITVENPTLFTVHVLREYLVRSGLEVTGDAMDADDLEDSLDYDSLEQVFSYRSHPLSDIISKVNKPSQNFIAETLQRTLGHEYGSEGSSREGRRIQMWLYDSLGMDTRDLQIRDGSGLSRHDLVSPNTTTSLLKMMWDHPYRPYFIESLPLAATSGTIRKRMQNTPAAGNVRAKTGYVGYVRSLSGYTWTRSGVPIIFSLMINHYTIPTSIVNHMQDEICAILSQLP